MLRADALQACGLFDSGFFLYFEEVELMWRLRTAGWEVWHEPASRVVHHEAASTGLGRAPTKPRPAYWYASRRRFFRLSRGRWAAAGADAAWLAGRTVAGIRAALGRPVPTEAAREARDLLRHSLLGCPVPPRAVQKVDDAPGMPPAWMARA